MVVFVIAGVIVALDQLTKYMVWHILAPGESLPIVNHVFHLSLVLNRGFAFGLFAKAHPIFIWALYGAVIILAAAVLCRQGGLFPKKSTRIFLTLIAAGALGNLIDRIRFSAVIDFLDFRIWPVFNLADSAITVGVSLLLWQLFIHQQTQPKQ
ncbi:MAG: signal peptidase II [Candidatus Omnitrophota bacterium]